MSGPASGAARALGQMAHQERRHDSDGSVHVRQGKHRQCRRQNREGAAADDLVCCGVRPSASARKVDRDFQTFSPIERCRLCGGLRHVLVESIGVIQSQGRTSSNGAQ